MHWNSPSFVSPALRCLCEAASGDVTSEPTSCPYPLPSIKGSVLREGYDDAESETCDIAMILSHNLHE